MGERLGGSSSKTRTQRDAAVEDWENDYLSVGLQDSSGFKTKTKLKAKLKLK